MKNWVWILLIYLLGLGLRLIYLFQCGDCSMIDRHFMLIDSHYYDLWAKSIVGGDLMGKEAFFMAPLYTYVLALFYFLFGSDFFWVRLLQTLAGSLTCLGVYYIGLRVFERKSAFLGALLCAIYSPFYYYENLLLGTSLIILLNMLSCLVLLKADQHGKPVGWFLGGFSLGLCAVAKANAMLAVPLAVIWIFACRWKKGIRQALTPVLWLVVGTILVVGSVTIRNAMVQQDFVLLTANGGINFYVGNNPESEGVWKRFRMPYPGANIDDHLTALATGTRAYRDRQPSEISTQLFGKGVDFILEQPGDYLALLGKKALIALNAFEVGNRDDYYFGQRFSWVLRLPLPGFGIVAPLGLLGILLCLRQIKRYFLPLLFILLPAVTLILIFVLARYRLPMVPFLCLFAALAVFRIYDASRFYRWPALTGQLLLLAGLALIVNCPIDKLDVRSWEGAAYAAYGSYLLEEGSAEDALQEADLSLALNPQDSYALNLRGAIYAKLGRFSEAVRDYQEARRLYPEELAAGLRLAGLFKALGRPAEAEAQLREVIRKAQHLSPQHLEAMIQLALLLEKDPQRLDEALGLAERVLEVRPSHPAMQALFNRARR